MNRFQQFMQGRYGIDKLSRVLFIAGFILSLLGLFLRVRTLSYLSYVPFAVAIFRMMSRNHVKRMKENSVFTTKWNAAKNIFHRTKQNTKQNMKDRKLYKYIKCPGCKAELRVPKGKGKINVRCPKCDARFRENT